MWKIHLFALLSLSWIFLVDSSIADTPDLSTPSQTSVVAKPARDTQQAARSFQFHYRFEVSDLVPGKHARIWLPVPPSNDDQQVTALLHDLPSNPTFHTDTKYDNRILYLETLVPADGKLSVDVPYHVTRREVRALDSEGRQDAAADEIDQLKKELFLQPNAKVPVDGKPLDLLRDIDLRDDAFQLANQLYEIVDRHVAYNKDGSGWGQGDVLWVCDSGRGNCTDFHSLFISLARSQGIPARFEIGFPIPTDAKQGSVGGYHCWAWFFVRNRGWIPVDISEADKQPEMKDYYFGSLTPDRVTFSVGRDIELHPESSQGSLNFFVYPHVEVDTESVSRTQITLQFSYADVPGK